MPFLDPDAAGIDVGASELYVAVSVDRDRQPVRSFPTFTRDLYALADCLQQCGIHSVAMESTIIYWIPIYQILEARALEVFLVNAQHVKNEPGRRSDVSAFASWPGLCPGKKISGGKILFPKSRRVRSREATALRMGAQSLHHAKDYLGEFFRHITRKLGRPQAITDTAHKPARILFYLLSTKDAYNESVFHNSETDTIRRAECRLRWQAAQLGFQITPAENG